MQFRPRLHNISFQTTLEPDLICLFYTPTTVCIHKLFLYNSVGTDFLITPYSGGLKSHTLIARVLGTPALGHILLYVNILRAAWCYTLQCTLALVQVAWKCYGL